MSQHVATFVTRTIAQLAVEKQHPLNDPVEIAEAIWNSERDGIWLEAKQIGTIMNIMAGTYLHNTPDMILKISHYLQMNIPKHQQNYPSEQDALFFRRNPYLWGAAKQFFVRHDQYEDIHFIM